MRASPTDRGYAYLKTNADGTTDVYVAVGVGTDDAPEDIFAVHFNRDRVAVADDVRTVAVGAMRRTTEAVQVTKDAGHVVHIRGRNRGYGPLLGG
ncbi:hypothetical protein [Yinghuangia seranimata]|uniref:hypothetical protein n=1 Tax=Yinghuangia seranimata TaxID=408067 RepID=UPI00248D16A8|nr:hypothetical protein [Yinghuangia seranimata]MDI2131062.1 hypothetical protein [Yinghuangia seranimata]